MKLQFKHQAFQTNAVQAVVDLFLGQEKMQSTFGIQEDSQTSLFESEYGIGNKIAISNEMLVANMHAVQKRNHLPLTDADFFDDSTETTANHSNGAALPNFCIEMETGTGKTYVFTKTMFELHKQYGFTKFIIVVPSVAIREGVYKSLQITDEHFANQFDNVPRRYFIYNSARLSDVRQFATSANIEVMIINIDAFKKSENIINQAQDRLNGETAMRYIQDSRPIVIIDEPQSVDNTPKAKEAIASLHPLCILRYSATHREKINPLFRLTPVDAYQMGLVKQICVSSNQSFGDFNQPYIRLVSVTHDKGFKAIVEIDVQDKKGKVSRKTVTVRPDSDLFLLSGERALYDGYIVSGIDCTDGFECVEFSNTQIVQLGKAIGSVDELTIKRAQIRRTIETHLTKELMYHHLGIKVLSLFFIDEVGKYRKEDGSKGIYANLFEECYTELISSDKYAQLKEKFQTAVNLAHGGYFSQDKKGNYKNTKGDTLADYDTYSTIMKDKEWLLSFDCPLRFIFSHSALKEGWDNPNVFQVCTLIDQKSAFTARQKIGRGLRLCVNQDGERIEDRQINILHVMANESFAEFAQTLQKEIEQETGLSFGYLDIRLLSGMVYEEEETIDKEITQKQAKAVIETLTDYGILNAQGQIIEAVKLDELILPDTLTSLKKTVTKVMDKAEAVTVDILTGMSYKETVVEEKTISYDEAKELIEHFEQQGYVEKSGKINNTMKQALLEGKLDLPQKFEAVRKKFESVIQQSDKKLAIRDASRDVTVRLNKKMMLSEEFQNLWHSIKQKTAYRVNVDTETLIQQCISDISEMEAIPEARIISQTADIHMDQLGVTHTEKEYRTTKLTDYHPVVPNIVSILAEQCLITRRTVNTILQQCGRLSDFLNNPQLFIERVTDIVNYRRHHLAIDGISYIKLEGEEYSVMEVFDSTEFIANLDKNAIAVHHSVYDYVIYDSETIEKPFAIALDNDPNVKMFFKIPSRFTINTPIGTYNPDWAIYFEKDGVQKLYFVLETKGSDSPLDLRSSEKLKIQCGRQHFKALGTNVQYEVTKNWDKYRLSI